MRSFAFMKGWGDVPYSKLKEVKSRIKEALCISSDSAFYTRMRGEVEPLVTEVEKIEAIFAEYGIKDIWGNE